MNPAALLKLSGLKNTFNKNHPKVQPFLNAVYKNGLVEDTIIEISVTKPNGENLTSNIKLKQEDIELIKELQNITKG